MMRQANVIDMYHGDNKGKVPDFAALKKNGIIAVIHKATQGSKFVDEDFKIRLKAARDAGLLTGTYHFGDASPATDQFQHFMNTVQPQAGDFIALDFERNRASQMTAGQAAQFMDFCTVEKFAPVLYGSDLVRKYGSYLCTHYKPYAWMAEYGPRLDIPRPWKDEEVLLWQFSGSGSIVGITGHVDLNYFNGSADALRAKWGKPCLTVS